MAIGMIVDMLGVTRDQYEQVRREVMPDNRPVAGLLYHAAGPTPHGWLLSEVWESRETLDRFFEERFSAALQRPASASSRNSTRSSTRSTPDEGDRRSRGTGDWRTS